MSFVNGWQFLASLTSVVGASLSSCFFSVGTQQNSMQIARHSHAMGIIFPLREELGAFAGVIFIV